MNWGDYSPYVPYSVSPNPEGPVPASTREDGPGFPQCGQPQEATAGGDSPSRSPRPAAMPEPADVRAVPARPDRDGVAGEGGEAPGQGAARAGAGHSLRVGAAELRYGQTHQPARCEARG